MTNVSSSMTNMSLPMTTMSQPSFETFDFDSLLSEEIHAMAFDPDVDLDISAMLIGMYSFI